MPAVLHPDEVEPGRRSLSEVRHGPQAGQRPRRIVGAALGGGHGGSMIRRSRAHNRRPAMSAKLTLRPIGVPIPALLAMSVLASSALAQAPPFLLQWGTPGTGAGQFDSPS